MSMATKKVFNKSIVAALLAMACATVPLAELETMMSRGPYKPPAKRGELGPLDYDDWLEANYEELKIAAAESGSDREFGFDFDYFAEQGYERYEAEYWEDNPLSETFKKAEEKRQRRLERNKRNRPIRGCYDA